MKNLFKRFMAGYHEYATIMGRRKAREVLLRYDERQLTDMGISRNMVESGLRAWPWRIKIDETMTSVRTELDVRRAANELRQLTDAELWDIGITRGTIVQAVRFGREGLEYIQQDKVA